ncbi:DUF1553 domain-containing protein [Telmatocola sphagniphila]|uniref:DUF1553 domain-containing protein n=2 Tax=Telmatocola sphagniphila TaxID=1123043 RepID=A0A8E6BBD3_9BACT|nr:DUF1553 domain-containing protein [Telmatocola sphagniphila]
MASRKVRDEKLSVDKVAQEAGLNKYFLDRWVKYLDPANAAKVPAEFKEWFTSQARSESLEFIFVAASLAEKIEKIEVPEKGNKPAKGQNKPNSLMKAMVLDDNAPYRVPPAEAESRFLIGSAKQDLVEMRKELDSRKKKSPPQPPRAPVVSGAGQGMKVYIRGNPMTKGEDAPKGFLQVLATTTAPQPAPKDYTRLDLAKAISNPENPLTARVYVNRVWQGHFGKGLVNTPSNFGSLGSKPSHAELLDFLAAEFVKQGWSTKWLHRQIMLSSTYQLASDEEPANNKIDAGNVYLWRSSRHRLDIESWRDSLLNAADRLDTTMGGPTFNLHDASARRRTVYAKISRHELDGLLRLFDFPDANVTADKRTSTTVPQQQLFALNSEFMVIQAKAFAERIAKLGTTDEARVTAAYKLAYGRLPESRELELGLSFLKTPNKPEDKLTRWQQYAQALLAANEFMYVD